MSRVAKNAVVLPKGVEARLEGLQLTVKGQKGTLTRELPQGVGVSVSGAEIAVDPSKTH
ncbi:MAG: 50S ribosomal protein L6, partial [Methylotetracoccus sp.]